MPGRENLNAEVCEIFCFDEEKVNRLRPEVARLQGVAEVFKALADDTRARIVYALSKEELCVCDVAGILGITVQAASYHLRLLKHLRVVRSRKEGKLVFYSLDDQHVVNLVNEAIAHAREG